MEKEEIIHITIDYDSAVKDTAILKENVEKLRKESKLLEETEGKISEAYIKNNAVLKSATAELRQQEGMLQKIVTSNNAADGSIEQMRTNLGIVTKQWSQLSEQQRQNTEEGIKLTKQKLELTEALKKEEIATGDARRDVGNYEKASVSLRTELKAIVVEMGRMAMAGDESSKAFKELSERGGKIKDTLADISARLKIVGSDTKNIDMIVGSFMAMGSAIQIAEGSMALFGVENEDVARSIQKMVAIQGIMNGLQEVANALQKESAFMLGVASVKTAIQTGFQKLLNASIWETVGASKAMRIALISTGIGAVVVGLGLLVGYLVTMNNETEDAISLNKQLNAEHLSQFETANNQYELNKKINAEQTDNANAMIEANKKLGASDVEIAKQREEIASSNLQIAAKTYDDLVKKYGSIESLKSEADRTEEFYNKKRLDGSGTVSDKEIENAKNSFDIAIKQRDLVMKAEADAIKSMNDVTLAGATVQEAINQKKIEGIKKVQEARKKQHDEDLKWIEEQEKDAQKTLEDARKNSADKIEIWKLENQNKLKDNKFLSQELVDEESKRLEELQRQQIEFLSIKELTEKEFELKSLEIQNDINKQKIENQKLYSEQIIADNVKIQAFQSKLNQDSINGRAEAQRNELERQYLESKEAAERTGQSLIEIEQSYSMERMKISMNSANQYLALTQSLLGLVGKLYEGDFKAQKRIKYAEAVITANQNSIEAFGAAQNLDYPYNLIVGGISGAAALANGLIVANKIKNQQPDSGGGSSTQSISAGQITQSQRVSAEPTSTSVGNGIVSRSSNDSNYNLLKNQVVLVVDDVTNKQMNYSEIRKTSTL